MLHKSENQFHKVTSSEEQLSDLCSNNIGLGCSSLEITKSITDEEYASLEELADIFLLSVQLKLDYERTKTGSNILSSINKRAS